MKTWLMLGAALLLSVPMLGCGSDDDNNNKPTPCQEGCSIILNKCGGNGTNCVGTCTTDTAALTQAQMDTVMNCLRGATSCAATQACIP